jgi:hypothetical protein
VFNEQATLKCRFAGTLSKPSDGLEPSTPSLPWNASGNRSQPTATVFGCLSGFRRRHVCDRLPPVATAGLHKGSIVRCPCWLRGGRTYGVARCGKRDDAGERCECAVAERDLDQQPRGARKPVPKGYPQTVWRTRVSRRKELVGKKKPGSGRGVVEEDLSDASGLLEGGEVPGVRKRDRLGAS